jgi:HEAT repeat protein
MTFKRLIRGFVYSTLVVAIAAFFAYPYTRQLVFGPKIRDVPLSSWQDSFRYHATKRFSEDDAFTKALTWMGVKSPEPDPCPVNDPDMLPVLLSLVDDPNFWVRREVAYSLGFHPRSAEASESLIGLLDDPVPNVREYAAMAFGNLKIPCNAAIPKLREHLDDKDEHCRVHSAYGLWRATQARDEKSVRILREGLHAGDHFIRADAALGLCIMGKDVPECFADVAALSRKDALVRVYVAATANGFGPVAIPLLVEFLGASQDDVRLRAARSLGKLGSAALQAVPALVRALDDSNGRVKTAAGDALSKIDPERFPAAKAESE